MKGKVSERFFLWYFANDGLSVRKKNNLLKLTTLLNSISSTINLLSAYNFQNFS